MSKKLKIKLFGNSYRRIIVSNKRNLSDDKISKVLSNSANLTRVLQTGIDSALLKHKQAGNSVCEWRDNKVVWIPAEEI